MKNIFHFIIVLTLSAAIMSCEKDNYEPPTSLLSGRLVYQGTPLNLEYNRVSYDIYQDGFGKTGPLSSTFTSEGEFSHLLYDGTYKMVVPNGQGPFLWENIGDGGQDTLVINLRGSAEIDVEVTPFWMIRNPQLSGSGNQVSGTFGLEQIVTNADAKQVESVTLYVSKTLFANSQTNVATNVIEGSTITDVNNLNLSVTVPELVPAQNYVFASIGVKLAGVDDLIFSPTQKIDL
ncbi:DUF3823 domain-containing protein [Catalinimonas niigatensis]|uniref:DUF3823 domain-containing protein n=1 Tax=Catalinimonas niigatensis TaxID=1397264 RepID=UPI0026667084|nr:DUF3823 domain-containing protein [Catalinimonas niigatensis]WPP50777.1 DUF3823 domain-containing protein [Catalinimonas niigatensis]